MSKYEYDIGIIGAGAAGLTVAAGAARLGAKVVLIEQSTQLGGDCLHYGCVPSKTLIQTARLYHQMKQAHVYGLPQISPAPVDFRQIAARIASVIEGIQKHDSVERFCALGVKVIFGQCAFQDEHVVSVDAKRLSAAKWVVATGTSPAIPALRGLDSTPYLTNKDIFSLDALPNKLLILGAGPVAVEMAQAFQRLGCEVTLVHRGEHILSHDDTDMTDELKSILEQEGVRFELQTTLESVQTEGSGIALTARCAGQTTTIRADALLVALGRSPNVAGLGLKQAGVAFSPKGIEVDARMRTSVSHIYACGDVTGAYQFTHAAGYEAGIVVANAIFKYPRKADYSLLPWCTFTDPELAHIGLNESMATKAGLDYHVWTEPFAANDRARTENATHGLVKVLLADNGRPLGVQILGHRAGDILAEWVAVLHGKLSLSGLAAAVHPYPTLAEINKAVAGRVLGEKFFSPTVKKALAFFFGLKGRACG